MIEDLPQAIDELLDQREMDLMRGIGESIETELQALRTTGYSPRHEELLARTGPGVLQMMEIQGLGMRRLQILFQEAGIASIEQLKAAAEQGELRDLPGFGESAEEKLRHEIEHWEHTRGKRYPLPEAKGLADSIRYQLMQLDEVDQAEVGGSIRRGRETIGDIDILVTTDDPIALSSYFKTLPEVVEVVFDGDTRASVRVIGGVQVDLRVLQPHLFGAGLHYFTGSKDHHIQMRLRSKKLGLKISEHGVCRYDDPDEVPVGLMETEEEVFAAVGMQYVPPEIRMGKEEISLAENGELPTLVEPAHLKGDVHVCSSVSGGRDDVKALLGAAKQLGYDWLVVVAKSEGVDSRHGVDNEGLRRWLELAETIEQVGGVRLLSGVEVEIQADGLLDLDHRLLAQADWVLAGLHQDAASDPDTNTQRMIWGLETGLVSCLASPTGRRLGRVSGYPIYLDEVVETCVDFGVALEMNAHPSKLDLNAQMASRARSMGATLVLGSEASGASTMTQIQYALQQARRAWLEPADVLNCRSASEMMRAVRPLVR